MVKLYSVGDRFAAYKPFIELFEKVIIVYNKEQIEQSFKEGDVILFEGGEDISPAIYNEKCLSITGASDYLSDRDNIEVDIFEALKRKAKFLGICRGAQLLCALSGGKLVQHVTNHGGVGHAIDTDTGETYFVSSTHHQMQWPWNIEHNLIAWSKTPLSRVYSGSIDYGDLYFPKNAYNEEGILLEPEVVFYPKTKSLAIQYHPEFMRAASLGVQYSKKLVKEYLL